jgi:hypothetical protein
MDGEEEDTAAAARWQPLMIILRQTTRRLECATCGALAILAIASLATDEQNTLEGVSLYCQSCYLQAAAETNG